MTFFVVVELLIILLIALVVVVGVVDAVGSRSWRLRLPLAGGDGGVVDHWRRLVATPRERYFAPRTPTTTTYRVTTSADASGGRELLVEFVSAETAQLTVASATAPDDVAQLETILDAIPGARERLESGKVVRVLAPTTILPLAASARVELVTASGEQLGPVRDGTAHDYHGHARLGRAVPVTTSGADALLEARPPARAFAARIDELLAPARENTARLLHRQRADAFEKCAGAARLCAEVRRELLSDPSARYERDLSAADRLVARPYEQARASLARFTERVERFQLADAKPAALRALWKRATEALLEDARLLACCAAVRYERGMLAAIAEVRGDPARASDLMRALEELRSDSLADLELATRIIAALSLSRSTLEQRFKRGTARLVRNAEAFKRRTRPMRRLVEEADVALLPPAPAADVGFLIEVAAQPELVLSEALLVAPAR